MTFIDLTGERFGMLTVISKAESKVCPSGKKVAMFLCKCDCGNEVVVGSSNLRQGWRKSCGCLTAERDAARGFTQSAFFLKARTNICFDCQNAVCGCEWSTNFEPVPGWTAEKTTVSGMDTYHIVACPKFKRDEPRTNSLKIPSYLINDEEPRTNGRSLKVQCITTGEVYKNVRDAAYKTGISEASIRHVCSGYKMGVRGTTWRYLTDDDMEG